MTAHFTVPGEPKGKARPRFSSRGGRTYTPAPTVNYEKKVKACYHEQCGDYSFGQDALSIDIKAYYPIPKSTSKKVKEKMLSMDFLPTKKPDSDNIIKIICDALNGIAYKDDAQIVRCTFNKYYDEQPGVDVSITNEL